MGNVSSCSFILGWDFHRLCKPPFSWFAPVIAQARAITCASCQGLDSKICCISIINWWNELFFCILIFRKVQDLGKLKVTLIIVRACSKIDHGTLKSGVSHKLFDELSRFFEWFLRANSDGIIFGVTASLLYVFDI